MASSSKRRTVFLLLSSGDGELRAAEAFPCLRGDSNGATKDDYANDFERVPTLPPSTPRSQPRGELVADFEVSGRLDRELPPKSMDVPARSRNFISDAVIGSLPRGLTPAERLSVSKATPLSSTITLLSSLPRDKVAGRDLEGKLLRRHALKGAVLVFVTAGYSGKKFVFEKAKELGVRSVVIDGPDSWSKSMVEEGIIHKFIGLDMSDADTVFDRCLEAIKEVKEEMGELDGVLSFCEIAQPLVARLAERLGLPGNSPAAVDAARDKHETRRCLAAAGLPTPKNFLITNKSQLTEAAAQVGFPAVIKPISGAASIGVVRVDDMDHLQTCYKRVCHDVTAARVVAGALVEGDASSSADEEDPHGNAGTWMKTNIMMEEYLDGPEVDVDLVFWDGQPVYGAVNDNWECLEPWFNETGSNGPSTLPIYQQRELCELGVGSVQSLGFTSGVFHVELKYTSRGARLIEVNCRMGGGVVRLMNLLVWGVDMVEEQLLCSAGIPSRPHVSQKPLMYVAEYLVNAKTTGILRDVDFLEKYQGIEGIIYARAMVPVGSKVTCKEDGLPTWVCQVLVTKPTLKEAIEWVTEIEAEISEVMPIDPLPANGRH